MSKKVAIVLVNYNGENFQNECVESICNMEYRDFDIIIVDNGSKDNSVQMIKDRFKDVILIETGENNGVAKGNNIGIQYALDNNYEYILLLNNDTEVDKYMLGNMMKRANEKTLVTCKMYYYEPQNRIWCAGGKINWKKGTTTHFGENENDIGQYDNSKYVEYTPTCCLLIHRDTFEKIGLMDEKYFMYYDDTDFCVRANNNGFKIWYESTAKLWHKVSSSSGGLESKISIYYGTRNRLYFIDKYYDKKFSVSLYFYITRGIKCFKYVKRGLSKYLLQGILDYHKRDMYIKEFK